jgi:hypothetical protein
MSTANPLRDALDDLVNEATAIEPQRVLVLNEDEQVAILDAFDGLLPDIFAQRIAHGETYVNETDELVRVTLRKRRLEEEVRRCNRRIADLEPVIVEQLTEIGVSAMKHDATGATLRRRDKAWIKYVDENLDTAGKAAVKAQAAAVMQQIGGEVADLVKPDYNGNTVSAFFREQYLALVAEQLALPEHERRPVDPDALIPEPLREYLRLDAQPHIEVRA